MNPQLKYREGYKYQVFEDYVIQTMVQPPEFVLHPFFRLDTDGALFIKAGYAWDGPSGPAPDTPGTMVASLVHDALYQMLREGLLRPLDRYRKIADEEFCRLLRIDGMGKLMSGLWYSAVRVGGLEAASAPHPVLTAPVPSVAPESWPPAPPVV